jgi:hypothetical protein
VRGRVAIRALIALLVGAAFSFAKLQYHCRMPASETCVWSRAYYPVTLPIETIVFGAFCFAEMMIIAGRRRE